MALKNQYLIDLLETVKKRNAGEPEFIQAVMEDLTSLRLVFSSVSLSLRDRLFSVCLGLMIMARHR